MKQINPSETMFEYGYDSNKNLTAAKSNSGIRYNFAYDSNGNVTNSEIFSSPDAGALENGKSYYIRNRKSGMYLTDTDNYIFQYPYNGVINKKITLVSTGDGCFKLVTASDTSHSATVTPPDSYGNGCYPTFTTTADGANNKFKIVPNNDGSYKIYSKQSDFKNAFRMNESSTAMGERARVVVVDNESNTSFDW